jgi:hypothetical protein
MAGVGLRNLPQWRHAATHSGDKVYGKVEDRFGILPAGSKKVGSETQKGADLSILKLSPAAKAASKLGTRRGQAPECRGRARDLKFSLAERMLAPGMM